MKKINNYCISILILIILCFYLKLEAAQIVYVNDEVTKVRLELEPDEVAIFAYGSLMLLSELERQRPSHDPYTGPFIMTRLKDFKRTWSAHYPNNDYVENEGECFIPKTIAYLNVEFCEGSKVNGVLFVCSKEDLELYDHREAPYNRIKINDYLEDVSVVGGDAYVYVAKPESYLPTEGLSIRQTIIKARYLDKIEKALKTAGEEFMIEYMQNTQEVPSQLVVED